MNFSFIAGLIILGTSLYLGVFDGFRGLAIFLDQRAFAIVVLGTLAVSFLSYPYAVLSKVVDYVLWGFLFRRKKQFLQVSKDIVAARSSFLINQSYLTTDDAHPFFRECVLFLLNRNINNTALKQILHHRLEHFKQRYHEDYQVLKSLSKYPAMLGVLAAAVSIVQSILSGQNIWLGVVSGLVSISLGIALTCFFMWPVTDSAHKSAQDDFNLRHLIVDGMILIREKATDEHFQAYLRGYLDINDRLELKVTPSQQNTYPFAVTPKIEIAPEEILNTHSAVTEKVNEPQETSNAVTTLSSVEVTKIKHKKAQDEKVEKPFEQLKTAISAQATSDSSAQSSPEKAESAAQLPAEKTEPVGRVEGSIHIDPKAAQLASQMNFKTLRQEMRQKGAKKAR